MKHKKLLSNIILAFLIIALPLFVWAVLTQRFDLRERASTSEPTSTPTMIVNWETAYASFLATDFSIMVDGQTFKGSPVINIHSDPGSSTYTTLEATWHENNVEMRMFLYFNADSQDWWLEEARIYNGQANGDWIYLIDNAQIYKTPIGQKYRQNTPGGWLLAHNGSADLATGVHFNSLELQGFVNRIVGGNIACLYNPPGISIYPLNQSVLPGEANQFTIVFNNNDSGVCNYSDINLTFELPGPDWSIDSQLSHVSGSAGDTTSFDVRIINPSDTEQDQTYYPVIRTSEAGIGSHSTAFTIPYYVGSVSASPSPVNIDISGDPWKGNSNAPITIVEFGDFECPFCKTFVDQTLDLIMSNYPDKIKFVYKDYPLNIHPHAFEAAEAAQCAFEQNKFWEMHDKLFEYQGNYPNNPFVTFATQLGLNLTTFNDCMTTHRTAPSIVRDIELGNQNDIVGTPSFFINGIYLPGALPFEEFQTIIDELLGTLPPSPSPSPTGKVGDVNRDNRVNLIDIGILIDNYDSTNPTNPRADINGSGRVDLIDIGLIIDNYEW